MRNMEKQKEKGREILSKHEKADLTVPEMMKFKEGFHEIAQEKGISEAIYRLIGDVFYSGVAVGYRTGKKDSTK